MTTTSTAAAADGWAIIHYRGYHNISVTRAAYRNTAGWVAAPGQSRPVVGDDRIISVTPMRVATEGEVILPAISDPLAPSAPARHLCVVS